MDMNLTYPSEVYQNINDRLRKKCTIINDKFFLNKDTSKNIISHTKITSLDIYHFNRSKTKQILSEMHNNNMIKIKKGKIEVF